MFQMLRKHKIGFYSEKKFVKRFWELIPDWEFVQNIVFQQSLSLPAIYFVFLLFIISFKLENVSFQCQLV